MSYSFIHFCGYVFIFQILFLHRMVSNEDCKDIYCENLAAVLTTLKEFLELFIRTDRTYYIIKIGKEKFSSQLYE